MNHDKHIPLDVDTEFKIVSQKLHNAGMSEDEEVIKEKYSGLQSFT